MRAEDITEIVVGQLFGRLMRRFLAALAVAALAIVALYQFTVAGTIALDAQYGMLNARLAVGGIYAVVAGICVIGWRMQHSRAVPPALPSTREMQITMLVEAVMLGYAMARKAPRTS